MRADLMTGGLATASVLMVGLIVGRVRRTRRREAELVDLNQQLTAMGERLTTLLEHTDDAVVISSDHGSLLWTSPSFSRLLGWEGPIERVDAPQLVHPDDVGAVYSAVRELREGLRPLVVLDVRVRHRDGRYLMTRQLYSDCRSDPVISGIVVTMRDVSEHNRVVSELTADLQRYRFLAENASEVLVMASADRIITYVSATANAVLERAPASLVGRHLTSLIHADDRVLVDAALTHAQWTGDVASVESRVVERTMGNERWVNLVARCVQNGAVGAQFHVSLSDVSARRDAETAMAASEQRFRGLAAQTRELVTVIDLAGTITYVSPSVQQVLGHDPNIVVGQHITRYLHRDEFADLVHQIVEQSTTETLRHRAVHADGSYRWLETLARLLGDRDAERRSVLLSSRDITDRLQLEQRLDRERGMLSAILDSVHAGVIAVDRRGVILEANRAFCRMLDTPVMPGTSMVDYGTTHQLLDELGSPVPLHERPIEVALTGRTHTDRLFVVVRRDGRRSEVIANSTVLFDDAGEIDGAVLTYEDVTDLRAAQHELRHLATLDPLTGLPNRRHLFVHLAHAMQRSVREPERLALLFLDLDGFKPVNDTLGHDIGDELLRHAADRIAAALRPGDVVARYGGDEFVVVAEHVCGSDDARALARRIEATLSVPFEVGDTTIRIGCSAGFTLGRLADSADELIARADQAMYERKNSRKESTSIDRGGRQAALVEPAWSGVAR